jgi:hypothetical protein
MISDEPDEDADTIDFDDVLDTRMGEALVGPNGSVDTARHMPDWPPLTARERGLSLDIETHAWFQAHHADWRHEMRRILHAWMVEQTARRQTVDTTRLDAPVSGGGRSEDRP